MFDKKLHRRVAAVEATLADNAPHLGVSKSIVERLDKHPSYVKGPDGRPSPEFKAEYAAILKAAEDAEKKRRLEEAFAELSPETRLQFMAQVFGESDADIILMQSVLSDRKTHERQATERRERTGCIIEKAQRKHMLDVSELSPGSVLSIDLFASSDYMLPSYVLDNHNYVARRINAVVHDTNGVVHILRDEKLPGDYNKSAYAEYQMLSPEYADHQLVTIGASLLADDAEHFVPHLYLGSDIHVRTEVPEGVVSPSRVDKIGLEVGYLTLNGQHVF